MNPYTPSPRQLSPSWFSYYLYIHPFSYLFSIIFFRSNLHEFKSTDLSCIILTVDTSTPHSHFPNPQKVPCFPFQPSSASIKVQSGHRNQTGDLNKGHLFYSNNSILINILIQIYVDNNFKRTRVNMLKKIGNDTPNGWNDADFSLECVRRIKGTF